MARASTETIRKQFMAYFMSLPAIRREAVLEAMTILHEAQSGPVPDAEEDTQG